MNKRTKIVFGSILGIIILILCRFTFPLKGNQYIIYLNVKSICGKKSGLGKSMDIYILEGIVIQFGLLMIM